jgi:hypothetical protein
MTDFMSPIETVVELPGSISSAVPAAPDLDEGGEPDLEMLDRLAEHERRGRAPRGRRPGPRRLPTASFRPRPNAAVDAEIAAFLARRRAAQGDAPVAMDLETAVRFLRSRDYAVFTAQVKAPAPMFKVDQRLLSADDVIAKALRLKADLASRTPHAPRACLDGIAPRACLDGAATPAGAIGSAGPAGAIGSAGPAGMAGHQGHPAAGRTIFRA